MLVEIKFSLISTISRVFSQSPEKSLPDTYLNVLNSLEIATTVIDEEAGESKDKKADKKAWKVTNHNFENNVKGQNE